MSLEKFYELRENFIILGLTGKMQAGADKFVKILKSEKLSEDNKKFLNEFPDKYKILSQSEAIKYRRIKDFYDYEDNWRKFDIVEYKDVVLLFILQNCYKSDDREFANEVTNWLTDLGTYKSFESPRFCSEKDIAKGSEEFISKEFNLFLKDELSKLEMDQKKIFDSPDLKMVLKEQSVFFTSEYQNFARAFFSKLDEFSVYLRHKLIHISSYCLRRYGTLQISVIKKDNTVPDKLKDIYKIAEVINAIIKNRRKETRNALIIIDRLKNSYEMNFFREKYSGYYTISVNREEKERKKSIEEKINSIYELDKAQANYTLIEQLDQTEYLVSEFKEGKFEGFDVENCVQKADYHVWYDEKLSDIKFYDRFQKDEKGNLIYTDVNNQDKSQILEKTNEFYIYQPLLIQVLKLTGLIKQPGLITPNYTERIMQIAYNAKLNSGCISRQVGAVVTDKNFSVKGIGWNEVANGQVPCSSRDIRDFTKVTKEDNKGFTLFELGESDYRYKDNKVFSDKLQEDISKVDEFLEENLQGRPCSFCFKSHHNAYEAKENQVHTRSLHAEENAMLQISKYGGQPLNGGNLFTTASTCELCAKKAYQLGIRNIFYIDVYPGISNDQILNNGSNIPRTLAFQGAIGRGFNKLYEPFMSQKDELYIRTKFKPTVSQKEQALQLKKIIGSKIEEKSDKLKEYLNDLKDTSDIIEKMLELMEKGLEIDKD